MVLSVVTPVNQPDTAPGVVLGPAQWQWSLVQIETREHLPHCHTMTMLPRHS